MNWPRNPMSVGPWHDGNLPPRHPDGRPKEGESEVPPSRRIDPFGKHWKTIQSSFASAKTCLLQMHSEGGLTELERNELLVSHSYVVKQCTCQKI